VAAAEVKLDFVGSLHNAAVAISRLHWGEKRLVFLDSATSVLELGIDVGNLDRVIQIDSPPTVSSFLQRMGRTGRRPGTTRNCLFLATTDESLIRVAGLTSLWSDGSVEPVLPPPARITSLPSR
jgi:ATP-dependent Lhr-like helicase